MTPNAGYTSPHPTSATSRKKLERTSDSSSIFAAICARPGTSYRDGAGILARNSAARATAQASPTRKKRLAEGLAAVASQAASRKAVIALEALDHSQTDVVNTIGECAEIVKAIDNPGLATMFDFHNTPDEKESPEALVRKYFSMIRHVHINEMDGRHPGTGKSDYLPLFRTLNELKYKGWISLQKSSTSSWGAARIGKEAMATT